MSTSRGLHLTVHSNRTCTSCRARTRHTAPAYVPLVFSSSFLQSASLEQGRRERRIRQPRRPFPFSFFWLVLHPASPRRLRSCPWRCAIALSPPRCPGLGEGKRPSSYARLRRLPSRILRPRARERQASGELPGAAKRHHPAALRRCLPAMAGATNQTNGAVGAPPPASAPGAQPGISEGGSSCFRHVSGMLLRCLAVLHGAKQDEKMRPAVHAGLR